MLKRIPAILSPDLLKILRAMGHGDEIAIVDGNYPADEHGRRVVRADGVSATDMLDAILTVLPLDDFVECAAFRPVPRGVGASDDQPIFREFRTLLDKHESPKMALGKIGGDAFYDRVKAAYAVIATTEARLYGNIILKKGVVRPVG